MQFIGNFLLFMLIHEYEVIENVKYIEYLIKQKLYDTLYDYEVEIDD